MIIRQFIGFSTLLVAMATPLAVQAQSNGLAPDFKLINRCAQAARLGIHAADLPDAKARHNFITNLQRKLEQTGQLGEQTPGHLEVLGVIVMLESLLRNGTSYSDQRGRDWYVAQMAAACALQTQMLAK